MLVAEEAVEIRVSETARQEHSRDRTDARGLAQHGATVCARRGLPRYQREARASKLDPHKRYIAERVKAAAPDWIPATVLLRELGTRILRRIQHPQGSSGDVQANSEARAADSL